MEEKIDLVACLDGGYVMPTGVMKYSVCANKPDSVIDFHLSLMKAFRKMIWSFYMKYYGGC